MIDGATLEGNAKPNAKMVTRGIKIDIKTPFVTSTAWIEDPSEVTIDDLKQMIEGLLNDRPQAFKLTYSDRVIDNESKTLTDYNIVVGATINVTPLLFN